MTKAIGPLQLALAAPLVLLLGYLLMSLIIMAPPRFVVAPAHHHQAPPVESCYGALTNYGC